MTSYRLHSQVNHVNRPTGHIPKETRKISDYTVKLILSIHIDWAEMGAFVLNL